MADALAALRGGGILIPEVAVRAAVLERVELAVAAAILEGESGGGKNIWGHDGVPTGGTYVKGAAVTRESYLAYRGWMRAGSGRRQGAGPCQCTSAQYQDTADALGGTWDPLANCRSGFRGMGALVRAHGIRDGARRYNGAGALAEAYADRFMRRYDRWRGLLAGAVVPDVVVPPPAPPPAPKGLPDMPERELHQGPNVGRICCPTGGNAIVARAWVSVSIDGGGQAKLWFQRGARSDGPAPGVGEPANWSFWNAERPYVEIPAGTEFIQYQITANGPGSLLIEQQLR